MRVYMCVSLLHACGFLRNRACVLLHTHLPSMCYFIWEGAAVCVSVCSYTVCKCVGQICEATNT